MKTIVSLLRADRESPHGAREFFSDLENQKVVWEALAGTRELNDSLTKAREVPYDLWSTKITI